jgi:hypothetical protein
MVAGCMEQPRQHRTGCTPGDVVEALVGQRQHEPHGHDRPAHDKAALHDEHPQRLLELYGHHDYRFLSAAVMIYEFGTGTGGAGNPAPPPTGYNPLVDGPLGREVTRPTQIQLPAR